MKNLIYFTKNEEVKNSTVYLFSTIIAKFIPFILLPIITKYLLPEEYGKWAIFHAMLLFAIPVVGIAMKFQVVRSYYKYTKEEMAKLVFNMLILNLISTLLLLFILHLFSFYYEGFIKSHYLYLIPPIAFLIYLKEYVLTIIRYEKKPKIYAVFEIADSLILYIIAILLIVAFNYKWEGLLFGIITSTTLIALFAFLSLIKRSYIIPQFDFLVIKKSLKICAPLLPHLICTSLIAVSDRLILERMISTEVVGIYAVGYFLGTSAQIVVDAFNKSWGPWIYKQLNEITDSKKRKVVRVTYIYYAALGFLWLGVAILGTIYLKIFIDERYVEAIPVLYWAAFAAVIRGFYIAIFPYMTHMGKTIIYPVATGIAAFLNIIFTIYLTSIYGMVGAAQATALAFFIMFLIVFYYSQKNYPMPWFKFAVKDEK